MIIKRREGSYSHASVRHASPGVYHESCRDPSALSKDTSGSGKHTCMRTAPSINARPRVVALTFSIAHEEAGGHHARHQSDEERWQPGALEYGDHICQDAYVLTKKAPFVR